MPSNITGTDMQPSFKQTLKAKAHHLKPVVILGAKGLTPAVIEETHNALLAHELIKVKISGIEKEERIATALDLADKLKAELVQMIGGIAVLYRKNENQQ